MTTPGDAALADPVPRRQGPARRLAPSRATWPLWPMTVGMPLAWLVGIHSFVWCLPALVFGARILSDRSVRFPRSTIPLVGFLCWIVLSAAMLRSVEGIGLFAYRWLLFAGALAALVWLANVSRQRVPSDQIVDWMAQLWIWLIVFGYLGAIAPDLSTSSPFQLALGPLGRIGFVDELTRWRFAETQGFLGSALPRPAAPFNATNGWGAAVGILTPFFIRSWIVTADRARRRKGYLLGLAALYPILVSVNRGLWISLGVALAYFAARKALRGRFAAMAVLVGALLAVGALLVATPAGDLVGDRLDNSERSNDSRSSLYGLAYEGAVESPLVGNGAPERAASAPDLPPVGTHGLAWYLMFVHGFVGLALFVGWLAGEVWRSGRVRRADGWWTHLALLIGLVQVPFYGLLPQVVLFGIAAGLSHREEQG